MDKIKMLMLLSTCLMLSSSSCDRERDESLDDKLTLEKIDYNGNELRIDGYYYMKDPKRPQISVLILYQNGIILYGSAFDIDNTIEMEEQYKDGSIHAAKYKYNWGVFQINDNQIKYERWVPSNGPFSAFTYEGIILNDTTFVINKYFRAKDADKKAPSEVLREYHFKQFFHKPDSTNRFIL